jgi:hypothetical protein
VAYQYVREPLTADEADRLANACETPSREETGPVVWRSVRIGNAFLGLDYL